MGKPRMIILIRHAQSEGNRNRDIHQVIPDHRVKLTQHGVQQAEDAGRQLRSLLKPDDTLQFFTSPYRRTRETTDGILRTLTADEPTPSPFPRNKIKVYEEPRLREQDFGNFQPCSAEMERMWQERADYGHFFYRIPNGESAADAYDRVSGFNESLWRQFGEEDFPSVCVLVTHGLMTRIFLMKWYHWSVEYFEDLRNVNHCEFIVMKQSPTNNKYVLENQLRTWSDLKKRMAATNGVASGSSPSKGLPAPANHPTSPTIPVRRWGGCANGCNHDKMSWPRRVLRKNTADYLGSALPPPATPMDNLEGEQDDHPIASQEADHTSTVTEPPTKVTRKPSIKTPPTLSDSITPASPNDATDNPDTSDENDDPPSEPDDATSSLFRPQPRAAAIYRHLQPPSSRSSKHGKGTPGEGFSDDSDYFPGMQHAHTYPLTSPSTTTTPNNINHSTHGKSKARATSKHRQLSRDSRDRRDRGEKLPPRLSEEGWLLQESGMGNGARADALGDGDGGDGSGGSDDAKGFVNGASRVLPLAATKVVLETAEPGPGLGIRRSTSPAALGGEDAKEGGVRRSDGWGEGEGVGGVDLGGGEVDADADLDDAGVEGMKERDRRGFGEVY